MNRLLHAMKFAAEKHATQCRKNADATPYINHPIEVAEHFVRAGGISDEDVLPYRQGYEIEIQGVGKPTGCRIIAVRLIRN